MMQRQYWYRALKRAFMVTWRQLMGETVSAAANRAIIAIIGIVVLWLFASSEIASHEFLVMLSTLGVIVLLFPAFLMFNLVRAPAKMQAEADDRINQLEQTQATLTLSGPHLHNDRRFKNKSHWRMNVQNAGPAAARNVRMKLKSGSPEPKDLIWTGDYPYAVYPVGTIKNDAGHIGSIERQINTNDDEGYEITCCWKAESGGQFFTDINTKGGGHNNIQINSDERWKLSYEVTAENAPPIRFVLEIFIDDDEVKVVMVT